MSLVHSHAIMDVLRTVLDEERAQAVVEHRRITIKKPLTEYAAKLLVSRLAEWGDANEAADIMIERAWQGFRCDWVKDRRSPAMTGRRNFVDAAIDRLKTIQ